MTVVNVETLAYVLQMFKSKEDIANNFMPFLATEIPSETTYQNL
jgi:hypothetical protein